MLQMPVQACDVAQSFRESAKLDVRARVALKRRLQVGVSRMVAGLQALVEEIVE